MKVIGLPLNKVQLTPYVGTKGKYRKEKVLDDIAGLDTEVTSYWVDRYGHEHKYDYNNPKMLNDDGTPMIRKAVLYRWQVTLNGNKYLGRDIVELEKFLTMFANMMPEYLHIVYIHNLSYEFMFLLNFLQPEEVFARNTHKPIYTKALNIEFRCSYFLTQLPLSKWGETIGLDKSKDLVYNEIRTPLTPLTPEEEFYTIRDVEILDVGIRKYKQKYKHVCDIPLTQTGEVREELKKLFAKEPEFKKICWKLMPRTLDEMKWLLQAFAGGCVLANPAYKDRVIREPMLMRDLASSYPWVLLSERYPLSKFHEEFDNLDELMQDEDQTYIVEFRVTNVQSRVPCLFLSSSKVRKQHNLLAMNGRVATADSFEVTLTKPDFELFKKCYAYDSLDIITIKFATLEYLPDSFRKFIVEKYIKKTSLKDVDDELYMNAKQIINALFGINCQKLISDDAVFDMGEEDLWYVKPLDEETYQEKLHDYLFNKNGKANLHKYYTATQIGVYVTAYARQNLWYGILGEDENGNFTNVEYVIYTDTDSIKQIDHPGASDVFEAYNNAVLAKHAEIAEQLGIDVEDLSPKTNKGESKPIGVFAHDGECSEFKTLGCKKYVYRAVGGKHDGKLVMTLAGVPKDGVVCLNDDIENFKDGLVFTAKALNALNAKEKMAPHYLSDMTPHTFADGYTSTMRYGICLEPVDYTLSSSDDDYTPSDNFWTDLWALTDKTMLFEQ